MQYFAAFVLILFWAVNKLQCSDRVNNTTGHSVKLVVAPTPVELEGNKPIVLGREAEPLNLTCRIVYRKTERNDIPSPQDAPLPDFNVDWKFFLPNDNRNLIYTGTRFKRGQSQNSAWLWFESLAETDAGDYSCKAVSWKSVRPLTVMTEIHLSVKNKAGTCTSKWFRCHSSRCIGRQYLCDGIADCPDGEDETVFAGCGPKPCFGKVFCGPRCIPPTSCCNLGHCNASSSSAHLDPPGIISNEHQRFNDIGFLQTTIYTVIGCAMAFMFIVTILVIMICRVHMKRAMNLRCTQQIRNPGPRPRHSVPLYDLDVYLNRATNLNNQGGVTVTYNINNGVQFVGRPVEPPPYSEIAPVPPREGPPPPYVSQENLLELPIASNSGPNALRGNVLGIAAQYVNNDAALPTRISSAYQNSRQNSAIAQCFTSGQIPGPQATPGFNRFNMSLTCDDVSNTTLNTSDSTALNSSGNSDSSSTNSVGNFGIICRNITSHSQNFEPEYTETDSLLTDNQRELQNPGLERVCRGSDIPGSFLQSGQKVVQQKFEESLKSAGVNPEISIRQTDRTEVRNSRETSRNRGSNFTYKVPISKTLSTESSLLDVEFGDSNPIDDASSQPFEKNSFSGKEIDSTLQRLSSKTVLDLSTVGGESSDANLTSNNIETGKSLPFHLNLSNGDVDPTIVNAGFIKPEPSDDDVLKITEPLAPSDSKKYAMASSACKKESTDPSSSREDLSERAKDPPLFNQNQNHNATEQRIPVYFDVKNEQIIRVPLVSVGDNSISYKGSSTDITANDLSGDEAAKTIVRSAEAQPLVMPLRESFIGLQKD